MSGNAKVVPQQRGMGTAHTWRSVVRKRTAIYGPARTIPTHRSLICSVAWGSEFQHAENGDVLRTATDTYECSVCDKVPVRNHEDHPESRELSYNAHGIA